MTSGLLVVDKPHGPTSHDVVDRVRWLYRLRRVGHAGTLDPPATGILLVGLGRATRLLRFLQTLPKAYLGIVCFGTTTTTQDATGEVVEVRRCGFRREDLEATAQAFVGNIEQVPPMVSAVKVAGEPLYRAARRGEEVERRARAVTIHELAVEGFDPTRRVATIFVRCSSGTYVRALASEMGERLGCGAHLGQLRRLAVGSFSEADAVGLDELEALDLDARMAKVVPMDAAMRDFPSRVVDGPDLTAVRNGRPLSRRDVDEPETAGGPWDGGLTDCEIREAQDDPAPVAILDPSGELVAVYVRSKGGLSPAAVLAPPAAG